MAGFVFPDSYLICRNITSYRIIMIEKNAKCTLNSLISRFNCLNMKVQKSALPLHAGIVYYSVGLNLLKYFTSLFQNIVI